MGEFRAADFRWVILVTFEDSRILRFLDFGTGRWGGKRSVNGLSVMAFGSFVNPALIIL